MALFRLSSKSDGGSPGQSLTFRSSRVTISPCTLQQHGQNLAKLRRQLQSKPMLPELSRTHVGLDKGKNGR